ncbi:hypothetical protein J4419_01500 [Candidatus Woesearchaeota archaeon]|nr:hypothetical protein [Candidatus Woesearchaeota archaeon]
MEKRGQMQMMETVAILFIFFILISLGFIFYTQVAKQSIATKAEEFQDLTAIQVAQLAGSLPELQCSEQNIVKENCIDYLKAQAAPAILAKPEYFDVLGYATLTLQKIYPGTDEIPLYSRPLVNADNKRASFFPVAIFDPASSTTAFGVLVIEVYS